MNKVVKAFPLPDGFLQVEMQDGRCGEFDVKPYMNSDFFAAFFRSFHVDVSAYKFDRIDANAR